MTNTREIPIFFSINDQYTPYMAVAINSAVKNCSKDRRYRCIVLVETLSDENRKKILSLATDNFSIEFAQVSNAIEAITDRMSNRLRCNHFTLTIYYRLFIPFMFPQYDKGIYIDSDVVLCDDIGNLFDIEIGDNFFGGCNDISCMDNKTLCDYFENAVGVPAAEYINSGVLLMNLKKFRETKFEQHFLELLTTYHFDTVAPDQDYLNSICNGKIFYLDTKWNAMPNDAREPLENPSLIHYNLFFKPWRYSGIQYEDYFWKYAEDCGYCDELKAFKAGFTEEDRRSDEEGLTYLINHSTEIIDQEVTFKKIYDSGVKIRL